MNAPLPLPLLLPLLLLTGASAWQAHASLSDSVKLSWTADVDKEIIMLEIVAATDGWVGLGIGPSGTMAGADLIIGGVDHKGANFFQVSRRRRPHCWQRYGQSFQRNQSCGATALISLKVALFESSGSLPIQEWLSLLSTGDFPMLQTINQLGILGPWL